MKNKKIVKSKILIIPIILIILIILLIGFISYNESNIYIQTHTSGSFIWEGETNTYTVKLGLKFKSRNSKKIIESKTKATEKILDESINIIQEKDNNAFIEKHEEIDKLIYRFDNYIYYYRDNDFDKFYRYDIETKKIDGFAFSKYVKKTKSMQAFVVDNDIKTEALINIFPELENQIDNIDGTFYKKTFYDNERIFFEKNDIIYEYLHEKNKIIKRANIGNNNLDYIFVK